MQIIRGLRSVSRRVKLMQNLILEKRRKARKVIGLRVFRSYADGYWHFIYTTRRSTYVKIFPLRHLFDGLLRESSSRYRFYSWQISDIHYIWRHRYPMNQRIVDRDFFVFQLSLWACDRKNKFSTRCIASKSDAFILGTDHLKEIEYRDNSYRIDNSLILKLFYDSNYCLSISVKDSLVIPFFSVLFFFAQLRWWYFVIMIMSPFLT